MILPASVRYDDEVARADHETGRLLAGLGERAASALVIVAGDHGEAFGEHGEIAHSVFLYDTTLRVPLIIAGPGFGAGAPDADVSLADVLPTVLDVLGLPPRDVDGVSLLPLVNGHTLPPRDLYAETFAPLYDFGWSSLRSVRSGPWKYIAAPGPELYDVVSDAAEAENAILRDGPRARDLAARVAKYSGPEPPPWRTGPGHRRGVEEAPWRAGLCGVKPGGRIGQPPRPEGSPRASRADGAGCAG